jgi:hypothetical protein
MKFGFQTEEFTNRLQSCGKDLPPLLSRMSRTLMEMIEETDSPTPGDIQRLHGTLAGIVGSEKALLEICGEEGEWCGRCPFGAYLPRDVIHASPSAPFCLPWISVRSRGKNQPPA